jgi:hypothetical protein
MPDAVEKDPLERPDAPRQQFTDESASSPYWPRPMTTSTADDKAKTSPALVLTLAATLGVISGILLRLWRSHV